MLIIKNKNMKLSEIKQHLPAMNAVNFTLPNGNKIPAHFHITEVGQVTKDFIDCGGIVRHEKKVSFQLWESVDFDHRLAPQKLADIIELSEKKLGIVDGEIEVEYQRDTIGKYGLALGENGFKLTSLKTDCLAKDNCGIPVVKQKIKLGELSKVDSSCTPGSGCC